MENCTVKMHLLIYIIVLYFEYFSFLHDYFIRAHLELEHLWDFNVKYLMLALERPYFSITYFLFQEFLVVLLQLLEFSRRRIMNHETIK